MRINKDTESEITIKMPIWFRVMAWIYLLVDAPIVIWGLIMILVGAENEWYELTAVAFLLFMLGMWAVGMTTKLNLNKPEGFITVTSGHVPLFIWFLRKRIISKEEANSAFVAHRRTTGFYDVKLVTASGKEALIFKSRRAEVADYLAKRIASFSEQSEVTQDIINTQKPYTSAVKPSKRKPVIAGIILILAGLPILLFGIVFGFAVLLGLLTIHVGIISVLATSAVWLAIIISGIMAIIGGIFAISQRRWWLALVGAVCATIVPLSYAVYDLFKIDTYKAFPSDIYVGILAWMGVIAGILAIAFIAVSRRIFS